MIELNRYIIIVLLFFNSTLILRAQEALWTNIYNSGGTDKAWDIAVDDQGNVYVTGSKSSSYYFTVKYDADGNTVWTQQHSDPVYSMEAYALCIDSAGYIYVVGTTNNGSNRDIFSIKYDSAGQIISAQVFDAGGNETPSAVAVDPPGNIYVTGTKNGVNDWITIKYDSSWNLIWTQAYYGPAQDRAHDITVDAFGNCYVVGQKQDSSIDMFMIKYDSAGNTVWTQQYDYISGNDFGESIVFDSDGYLYITGASDSDIMTWKYDSNGNLIWSEKTGSPVYSDHAYAVDVDKKFNIYVTGYQWNGSVYNYYTVKYDKNRNIIWSTLYNSGGWDLPYGLAVDDVGYVYVTGDANNDYGTIKYLQDPLELYSRITSLNITVNNEKYFYRNGSIIGEAGTPGPDEHAIDYVEIRIRNAENGLCWNGSVWINNTNTWVKTEGKENWLYDCRGIPWDYGNLYYADTRAVTLKGFISDVSEKKEFIPIYNLPENSFVSYPNPFDPNNQTTTIEYLLTQDEKINLIIYDIAGHIVYDWTFFPGNKGAREGLNRISWDGKNKQGHPVANGIYFTCLKKNDDNEMTKIMVVK